jgi:hypothetical protein
MVARDLLEVLRGPARTYWPPIRGRPAAGACFSIPGDDNATKAEVAALIGRIGFAGISRSAASLRSFPVAHCRIKNLIKVG